MKLTASNWSVRLHRDGRARDLGTVEARTKAEAVRLAKRLPGIGRADGRFLIVDRERPARPAPPPPSRPAPTDRVFLSSATAAPAIALIEAHDRDLAGVVPIGEAVTLELVVLGRVERYLERTAKYAADDQVDTSDTGEPALTFADLRQLAQLATGARPPLEVVEVLAWCGSAPIAELLQVAEAMKSHVANINRQLDQQAHQGIPVQ